MSAPDYRTHWRVRGGEWIAYKDMTSTHLIHVHRHLVANSGPFKTGGPNYYREARERVRLELCRRDLNEDHELQIEDLAKGWWVTEWQHVPEGSVDDKWSQKRQKTYPIPLLGPPIDWRDLDEATREGTRGRVRSILLGDIPERELSLGDARVHRWITRNRAVMVDLIEYLETHYRRTQEMSPEAQAMLRKVLTYL